MLMITHNFGLTRHSQVYCCTVLNQRFASKNWNHRNCRSSQRLSISMCQNWQTCTLLTILNAEILYTVEIHQFIHSTVKHAFDRRETIVFTWRTQHISQMPMWLRFTSRHRYSSETRHCTPHWSHASVTRSNLDGSGSLVHSNRKPQYLHLWPF